MALKINYLLWLVLTLPIGLWAKDGRTFIIKGDSTQNELVEHNGYLENSKITLINTSDKAIYIVWETILNTFPKVWDCSMCQHGKCQIGIPKGAVFKKLDAGREGFIAIHVLPQKNAGSGCVKFKIYDKEHPEYFKVLTFSVKVL